jgi:hypothetical protein
MDDFYIIAIVDHHLSVILMPYQDGVDFDDQIMVRKFLDANDVGNGQLFCLKYFDVVI